MGLFGLFKKKSDETKVGNVEDFISLTRVYFQSVIATNLGITNIRFLPDVANFKRLDDVILDGDQYRLQSPYESQHAAVMYANDNADKAVLFAFDIHPRYAESIQPLRLQGLKEDARYELKEINLVPGTQSRLACNGKTFSGEFLMNVGIPVFSSGPTNSHVIEFTEVK